MLSSLNLFRQFESPRDIPILAPLVTAAEQNDSRFAAPDEIHPIARTMIDPHLRHALASGFTSPGLPSERRRIRTVIRARASRSRNPANQAKKT
jgi:hypothetical protein